MRTHLVRAGFLSCASLLATLLAGCAGYRIGATLPPGVRSVHVPTFLNQCGEPGVEAETTRATIQEFQRDGNLWIVPAERADAVLRVTVVEYKLEPLRYSKDGSRTPTEYRLRIVADLVLQATRTSKTLFKKRVIGESTFPFAGDLTSARINSLPTSAKDLAHEIVGSVVEYW